MTSDYSQQKEAQNQPKFFGLSRRTRNNTKPLRRPLELTRNNPFLDGHQDIFDVLAHHNIGTNLLSERSVKALQKAQTVIEDAEKTISAQAKRIETLESLKRIDELTGLYNALGFEEIFKKELARTKRFNDNAGIVVLIDVESHDYILDRYGAGAAKSSLKLVSKILSGEIRDMDIAARLSRNEFALLFSNTAADKIVERVQKLALRINNLSFIWKAQEININASLALRGYGPNDSYEALFTPHETTEKAKDNM